MKKSTAALGFSLVEVLVATIVMTMMMVSVIAYIQYGGEIWQKGHNKIAAENYKRMALEMLRQDLARAIEIEAPPASSTATLSEHAIGYKTLVGGVVKEFKVGIATASEHILFKQSSDPALSMRIARNVANFLVTRISTWTIQIQLQIQSDTPNEDGTYDTISSDTVIMMAPGAG